MKTIIFILSLLLIVSTTMSNDGAFYAEGNLLIPIRDNVISVPKEILSIDRIDDKHVKVTVEYTFYNEQSNPREVVVGFEASSPYGDVEGMPHNGEHPYIKDFSVKLNNDYLHYDVALVKDSLYEVSSNHIIGINEEELLGDEFNTMAPDFYYVYYFSANFNPGENYLVHTYTFKLSGGIGFYYYFDYLLSPAARWKNGIIKDFTLQIDMGEFEEFYMEPVWSAPIEWEVEGVVKDNLPSKYNSERLQVFTRGGSITYHCDNFYAEGGDLKLYASYPLSSDEMQNIEIFDASKHKLPFPLYKIKSGIPSIDERSYKILRNLPFARRGYIFKTDFIQKYYESLSWYSPDPDYDPVVDQLTPDEVRWVKTIRTAKWVSSTKGVSD